MKLSKRAIVWGSMCVALTLAATAYAGQKYSQPVVVLDTSAYGAMGSARASADTVQYIGCSTTVNNGTVSGYCAAKNSAGKYLNCTTTNPTMLQAIAGVNGVSYVHFGITAGSPNCTYLSIAAWSHYPPMVP